MSKLCDLEQERNPITSVAWSEKVCLFLGGKNLVTERGRERERERSLPQSRRLLFVLPFTKHSAHFLEVLRMTKYVDS